MFQGYHIHTLDGHFQGWFVYVLYVIAAYIAKLLNMHWIGNRILAHSDGGGWDAGTEHSYVPNLRRQYSVNYDDEFGHFAQNKRVRVLWWCLVPVFGFVSIIMLGLHLATWVFYFFTGEVTDYATPEMCDGTVGLVIDDDQKAWDVLIPNFKDDRGIIRRKSSTYTPTKLDYAAINHLCNEWDYAWEGN